MVKKGGKRLQIQTRKQKTAGLCCNNSPKVLQKQLKRKKKKGKTETRYRRHQGYFKKEEKNMSSHHTPVISSRTSRPMSHKENFLCQPLKSRRKRKQRGTKDGI
ncbi:hypothetical protein PanWU01x14_021590 [Parasponia andersonii]|uniref:Uncharacterized protein n=1 Tax=Parasponia andersonii TaxID=3476 RepID=A0A2P5DY21_PARAD|nr:hypothetical protein PanWU01x14_021590 [Parasponia andersonii]